MALEESNAAQNTAQPGRWPFKSARSRAITAGQPQDPMVVQDAETMVTDLDEVGPQIMGSDIYDITVIAAFGGVVQRHLGTSDNLVHPLVLFVLTFPMLVGQISVLVFLNLDYDFTKPVKLVTEHPDKDKLLNILKMMMVVIVQLTMFSRILGSLRIFVFLLTPTTWEDVERPWPMRMKSCLRRMFSPVFVAPPAIIAIVLHGILDYNICMDSVSIIFDADSMKEAVYDSLAITFLADLGAQWWDVISLIFHMEAVPAFKFRKANQYVLDEVKGTGLVELPDSVRALWRTSSANHGVTARKIQTSITALVMFIICTRQAYVVGMAVDSNILPVSRDICSWWHFNTGETHARFSKFAWLFTESWLMLSSPRQAINTVADPDNDPAGFCNSTYRHISLEDLTELPSKHPIRTAQLCLVAGLVLLAQVYYQFNSRIREVLYIETTEDPEVKRITELDSSQTKLLDTDNQTDEQQRLGVITNDLKAEHVEFNSRLTSLQEEFKKVAKERDDHRRALEAEQESRQKLESSFVELEKKLRALESRQPGGVGGKKWRIFN